MKLYWSPGACSQAPHILMHEIGMDHDARRVDLKAKKLEDGSDYLAINPKGAVPALEIDGGQLLTENAVVLQYLAEQAPAAGLAPREGLDRWRLLEWLNFIATELHKSFSPLFRTESEDVKAYARDMLVKRFDYLESQLGPDGYLTGESFTIADAYAFVVVRWTSRVEIDLGPWLRLRAFLQRVGERPAVRQALADEGLN